MSTKWKTTASLVFILALSFSVRGLTAYFIHTHFSDPGWFQSGTYALFDRQAQNILDHKASPFWIEDPSRTEPAIYPPGYSIWLALIYSLTGSRSPETVQKVQVVLDSFSILLVVVIAMTAFSYRAGLAAGILASLSPLLSLYGAIPLADAPTSWLVLAAVLLVLIVIKNQGANSSSAITPERSTVRPAKMSTLICVALAGLMLGLSCWLRSNAVLLPVFWIGAIWFLKIPTRHRVLFSSALLIGFLVAISPLVIRNAVAFHVLSPTGLGVGTNLWEGIGETDRAAEFGAVYGDSSLVEKERAELGVTSDQRFELYYPDGVKRDRERTRKALTVIFANPVWYAGVMLRRMASVLKFAGEPGHFYGSSGINVTSEKCLPERLRGGFTGLVVKVLGMAQSVCRYIALPLMLVGVALALRINWRLALVLLSTIIYYLVVGSGLHTEFRYGLPMQALLFVFAGLTLDWLMGGLRTRTLPNFNLS